MKNKQGDMGVGSGSELEKLQRSDHDVLIRVETKMDSLTSEMRQNNTTMSATASDHEARIRVLEKSDEKKSGDMSGSIRTKNTIITVLGLLLTAASVYVLYAGTLK